MSNDQHYFTAIRQRLERLYDEHPNDARLREQISDEVDWIDVQLEPSIGTPDARAAVIDALFPPDIVEDGGKCITTMDASYNLQGALYDLQLAQSKKRPPDQVCINTIERVIGQIEKVREALATPATKTPAGDAGPAVTSTEGRTP